MCIYSLVPLLLSGDFLNLTYLLLCSSAVSVMLFVPFILFLYLDYYSFPYLKISTCFNLFLFFKLLFSLLSLLCLLHTLIGFLFIVPLGLIWVENQIFCYCHFGLETFGLLNLDTPRNNFHYKLPNTPFE